MSGTWKRINKPLPERWAVIVPVVGLALLWGTYAAGWWEVSSRLIFTTMLVLVAVVARIVQRVRGKKAA